MKPRIGWRETFGSPLARVFLLFMLGIILPTGFLVYLGIQSIRAENLLISRESQERVGKTAEALRDQSQSLITEYLRPFAHAACALLETADLSALAEAFRPLYGNPGKESPSMLLALSAEQRLLYPVAEVRRQRPPPWPALPAAIQAEMVQAETLEFQKHDYAAAARIYGGLVRQAERARWQAMLLTSRAACLAKGGQFDSAERDYQEILARYGAEPDPQGNPYGLIIRIQLGDLQSLRGQPALAAGAYFGVWQDLIAGRWDLSWEGRQFFVRYLEQRLEPLRKDLGPAEQARLGGLRSRWGRLVQAVEEAQLFVRRDWPKLQKRAREEDAAGQPFLFLGGPSELSALVYVPVFDPGTGLARGTLVGRQSAEPLQRRLKEQLDQLTSASGLLYRLEVGPTGLWGDSPQAPEGRRWPMSFSLAQIHPAPLLSIATLHDRPVERAAQRRRKVYLGMVALAALVIGVALLASWYAVAHEVEVAQLKARFVASMSHELKTPLSIIGLLGQKLQLGRYESKDEAQEYFAMLAEETERLKGLIEDVLDFSRLLENRQPYKKERCDLRALAEETVERFCHGLRSPAGSVQFLAAPGAVWVQADREAMRRVLFNLLDNAVKYSAPESLKVRVHLAQEPTGWAVLQVQDEGFGIAPEEQALVFDRFYRGKSASSFQSTKGVGLGLSIVQHIVSAHGGRVELQSALGKGSLFSVFLPLDITG